MTPTDSRPRRAALATAIVLVAGLWSACGSDPEPEPGRARLAEVAKSLPFGVARGYDLVLVTIDTTRADRLGCYGAGAKASPRIDALARRGLRFEQAAANAPITLPSHASLMTGLYPPNHGVRNNGTYVLGAEHPTLAGVLRGAGYRTGAAVGAFVLDARFGLDRGFESYDDEIGRDPSRPKGEFNERPADEVVDAALRWVAKAVGDEDEPFFLWAHLFDPHFPYDPPPGFRPDSNDPEALYAAEIRFADEQVGRLADALAERGRLEKTLFVVTADHGEGREDHGEPFHGFFLYDTTIRVPLILSCPSLFSEGRVVAAPVVALSDLMPSLLHLLGVESPPGLDGRNVFDPDLDGDRGVYSEAMLPLLNHGWASLHALRRAGDKYVRAPEPEYYDLVKDPGELENRVGDADATEILRGRLDELMVGWGDVEEVRRSEREMDPELRARLAALGYTRALSSRGAGGREDPKRMLPLYLRSKEARALTDGGRHRDALEMIRRVLRGAPENADAWETAALAHLRLKEWSESEACIRRALELSENARSRYLLGQLLLQQRRFDVFEAELRRALELQPVFGEVLVTWAESFAMRGRWEEARKKCREALANDPLVEDFAKGVLRRIDAAEKKAAQSR